MSDLGFRGYISSRAIRGKSYPQRVQNLLVRDYASKRGLLYLLSAVEHCMPGSYMILHDILSELPNTAGVICFSLFQLPRKADERGRIYRQVLSAKRQLHGALEDLSLTCEADIARIEDLLRVASLLPLTPFHGRDDKQLAKRSDPVARALLSSVER